MDNRRKKLIGLPILIKELHEAVRSKAKDGLMSFTTGSFEVRERTCTLCVLCGSARHTFPDCDSGAPLKAKLQESFGVTQEGLYAYPNQLLLGPSPDSLGQRQRSAAEPLDVDEVAAQLLQHGDPKQRLDPGVVVNLSRVA